MECAQITLELHIVLKLFRQKIVFNSFYLGNSAYILHQGNKINKCDTRTQVRRRRKNHDLFESRIS
jgi:hypothetical protein